MDNEEAQRRKAVEAQIKQLLDEAATSEHYIANIGRVFLASEMFALLSSRTQEDNTSDEVKQ